MSAASNYLGSERYVVIRTTMVVRMITKEVTWTTLEVTTTTYGNRRDYLVSPGNNICMWLSS